MTSRKLEDEIVRIRQVRDTPLTSETVSLLRKALKNRANLVVAEAAKSAGKLRILELNPDLLAAYARLFDDPVKNDPKCWGKTAIIQTLTALDYSESPPFVQGSTHVQMEPVWDGQEDAAGALRSNCILALPQCADLRRSVVFRFLVDALFDPLDPVRLEAARTIEQMSGEEAPLLLRMKARLGDRRPAVMGQVFDGILNLESEKGIEFVERFLKSSDPEVRDEAALAMGACRQVKAIQILIAFWKDTIDREFRSILLRAISSSREESGFAFLLSLVQEGSSANAASALDALELHSGSPEIQARIALARNQRNPGF